MKRRGAIGIALAGAAALAAVALLGCGGGGSSGSNGETSTATAAATTQLSGEEFVERANSACERGRGGVLVRAYRYLRNHRLAGRSSSELYAEMIKAVLLPAIEREMELVRALSAPPAQKSKVSALFAANRAAMKEVSRLRSVPSMTTVEAHFVHASKLARADGLSSCANSRRGMGG